VSQEEIVLDAISEVPDEVSFQELSRRSNFSRQSKIRKFRWYPKENARDKMNSSRAFMVNPIYLS